MESIFKAKSIAIVGVSQDTTKIGTIIFNNLTNYGYKGEIYLVNPKYNNLFNLPCYKSINDINKQIDVACISVPREYIKEILISLKKE